MHKSRKHNLKKLKDVFDVLGENSKKFVKEYYCGKCEYKSKTKRSITVHAKAKHEDARFQWDKCEYWSGYSRHIKKHK